MKVREWMTSQPLTLTEGDRVRISRQFGSVELSVAAAKRDELPAGVLFIAYGDYSSRLMGGDTDGSGMPTSKGLDVPLSRVYSVATFFKAFSLKPRGRHLINVCMGTACHVRGAVKVLEKIEQELGIKTVHRSIDRSELYMADECFFTGTAAHVTPIAEIDDRKIGNGEIGEITAKLQDIYVKVIRGDHPKYMHWCTPVYDK